MAGRKNSTDAWLHEVLNRVEASTKATAEELQNLRKHVYSLSETAVKQQGTLEEHIRRTQQNEDAIEKIGERMKPLEGHVSMWAGAGKVLAIVGILASILAAIFKILEFYF